MYPAGNGGGGQYISPSQAPNQISAYDLSAKGLSPERPIASGLSQLSCAISELHEVIDRLVKQLEPVCVPVPPTGNGVNANAPMPSSQPRSDVTSVINESRDGVTSCAGRLRALLNRIEL